MNYIEAVEYIRLKSSLGSRPGLSRISRLAALLGDPQEDLRIVHVAGTNGKGSYCAMLGSVLTAAGYSAGIFVSPCLGRFNECIRLCGEEISDGDFAEIISLVRPLADTMDDSPTEFELLTAAAFEYFRRKNCDIAIIEAGMGGGLDATNIIKSPLVSVITGVSLDHTAYLGDTIERIATEKAGIVKPGRPVFFGGRAGEAERVIRDRAAFLGSEFYAADYSPLGNISCSLSGCGFDYRELRSLRLGLPGLYQPENAAGVIGVAGVLRGEGYDISDDAVRLGLETVSWAGRFELLSRDPVVIYDGAHNPEGVRAACRSVGALFPGGRVNILSGVMRDKDYALMSEIIAPVARRVFAVSPANGRSLPAGDYAEVFRGLGIPAEGYPTLAAGAEAAFADSKSGGTPLIILGSLYMYADVRKALGL